jgi:chromate reductase
MGTAAGRLGTARAQYHLRQVLIGLNTRTMNKPEVIIGGAADAFDADGKLTDETANRQIRQLLEAFQAFVA